MAQHPTTGIISRLILILQQIPRYPDRTSVENIERYLINAGYPASTRTVQKDLVRLSEINGLPLRSDNSNPKGWFWAEDARIWDIPSMNPQMALTFILVNHFLDKKLPVSVLDFLTPYIKKANGVLHQHETSNYAEWADKIRVIPTSLEKKPPEVDKWVLRSIYEALLSGLKFQGSYIKRGENDPKSWKVNPLGLVFHDGIIYLIATIWVYESILHLPLHRFTDVEILDEKCNKPEKFNLDEHLQKGAFNFDKDAALIKIRFRMKHREAAHVIECPLSDDQTVEVHDDGYTEFKATVKKSEWLRIWIKSYGRYIDLLEPKELRESLGKEYRELAERYLS